jgi:metallopeptidase MepB
MAESTDFVNAFLKDIKEKLMPIAKVELDSLLDLKRAHIESTKSKDASGVVPEEAGTFHFWDFSYYGNLTKVRTHSFDEEKFSEYFSLERFLEGMMSTFSRLSAFSFAR